jgi:hypothetical protein
MNRRNYKINITINNRTIKNVVIDPHYELKHASSINDDVILELVHLLDGGDFSPETISKGFEYYTTDKLALKGKNYRLIWLLEDDQIYIGIINAYRRNS